MKLEIGQKWKTRHGNVVTVNGTQQIGDRSAFLTDGNTFAYADESADGVFYVFNPCDLNGQDLVELVADA